MPRKPSTRIFYCDFVTSTARRSESFLIAGATARQCALCIGTNKIPGDDHELCDFHAKHVHTKLKALLEAFDGDWCEMIATLLKIAIFNVQTITPELLNEILNTRLKWDISGITKPTRFNSTQNLKRYCRQKYKENPEKFSKPPKNSCSKQEFIAWAESNGIELSHFKTRAYRKRIPEHWTNFSQQPQRELLLSQVSVAQQPSRTLTLDPLFHFQPPVQFSLQQQQMPALQQAPPSLTVHLQTSQESGSNSTSSDDISEVEQCVIQTLTSMSN